jgi:hypothetical protein
MKKIKYQIQSKLKELNNTPDEKNTESIKNIILDNENKKIKLEEDTLIVKALTDNGAL